MTLYPATTQWRCRPALLLATMLLATMLLPQLARPQTPATQTPVQHGPAGTFTLRVSTDIVLTNVIVRDRKTGAVVKGLKASDFHISEDKHPQRLVSFDYQDVDNAAVLAEKSGTVTGRASVADLINGNFAANAQQLHDHRLMVFFFDLSSMQDEDIDRAVESATDFINKQMGPADLVALVSLSSGLQMDQDFTADKAVLLRKLAAYNNTDATAYAAGGNGSSDGTSDDASSFTADDSEFNALNTDRELLAIRTIAKSLERVDQRKSMLYFSGGLTRQGIENQASLRAATSEASRANMAIYAVDTRGLQALPPVGDASSGSLRGTAAYSGAAVQAGLDANFSSQETLSNLSADTGGKAFFDSNDFAPAFQQVQNDTAAYYILGFRSTNTAHDGTYRRLAVTVDRPGVKVEFRPGYYAPADFRHQKTEDREAALIEQLHSDLPATDVSVYLQAFYFRRAPGIYAVPVSLVVPGSQIPFLKNGDRDKANVDIIGQIKDAQGIVVGTVRDTVKIAADQAQGVSHRNIQYTTGFTLAPGRYQLKFVVRENQTGAMGSFDTSLQVPDLQKAPLKMSSVVLASQRVPAAKGDDTPLDRDGQMFVPNIPHVFRVDGHLYLLYEVYSPTVIRAAAAAASPGLGRRSSGPVHVLTSLEFLQNGAKVYETPPVVADAINTPSRDAVDFTFDVPLAQLKPGLYTCQVNVVDDAGGAFSFPRLALRVDAVAGAPKPAAAALSIAKPATP